MTTAAADSSVRPVERERWASIALWIVALGALVVAWSVPALATPGLDARPAQLAAWGAAAMLAALHQPRGRRASLPSQSTEPATGGLGLGALAAPALLAAWGPAAAATVLALAAALGGIGAARARGNDLAPRQPFAWAGQVALGALAAGMVLLNWSGPSGGVRPTLGSLALATTVYGVTVLGLRLALFVAARTTPVEPAVAPSLRTLMGSALLEAVGLAVGLLLALVGGLATLAAPPEVLASAAAAALAVVVGLLVAEAARLDTVLSASRAGELRLAGDLAASRELDPLTGVAAEPLLEPSLDRAYSESLVGATALGVVVFDLDHLGRINERFGRDVGHRAVVALARSVERGLQPGDLAVRGGGGRIFAVLAGTTGEETLAFAEAVRREVEGLEIPGAPGETVLTVSAGAAVHPEVHAKSGGDLLLLAEAAVRCSKRLGRNVALLDLGGGRYRSSTGSEVETGSGASLAPPKIFV